MEIKSLNSIITQIVLRNLGGYASSYLGNDIYFLLEAINLLKSDLGEDNVRKIIESQGKKWDDVKYNLDKINEISTQIKIFYDPIQNKKFEKKDVNEVKVQKMFKRYFRKTAKELSLMSSDIYDIFIILLNNTSISKKTIPNDAFKIIEHTGMRKMDTTDRKKEEIAK